MESQQQTKQHPVDLGIENAKEQIEDAYSGGFEVPGDYISYLQKNLREIWEEKSEEEQIPEEFASPLIELVALLQFHRIKDGEPLWDAVELEKVMGSIWEELKKWWKPSKPKD